LNPSYKQIADLFGLTVPGDPSLEEVEEQRLTGETVDESLQLGAVSLKRGEYEAAINHFKRAIEQSEPGEITGRLDLASAYEVAEMAPQALRQYEKAIRLRADSPEPHVGLSGVFKRNARYKDSIHELEEAVRLQPDNPHYLFKLAEVLREVGELDRALVTIQGAVLAAPSEAFYHFWVGDLLFQMKRYDESLEAMRAAIELSPGDDFLYFRTAAAFWLAGKRPEALKAIRLASDLDPEKHLYHGVLELLLSEMEQNEEADLEAARASRMDAYDHELLRRFADELGLEA
jgi:tetratricopeptide (TPR) repeat protein